MTTDPLKHDKLTGMFKRARSDDSNASAMALSSTQLHDFTAAVASDVAVPASGSVAALVAAQGVALLEMVILLTRLRLKSLILAPMVTAQDT